MLVITKTMATNFTFLLAFVLLVNSHMAMSLTNINTDKSALLTLKSTLNLHPSHILFTNWSSSAHVCDWIGVTCNSRHQRVSGLDISMMALTGTFVPQLGNLTFLVSLNLSRNNFQGVVPHEFTRLRRLKVVDFNFNSLSGEISTWFGSLSRLRILNLRNNSFTGSIPPSISNASMLEILDTSFNPLEGQIPGEIGNLSNLKRLMLRKNQLSGFVPFTLFNLSKMERLDLTGNSLSGELPSDMCRDLPLLKELYLSDNQFSGHIPSNISECSQLQILYMSHNKFGGHIPREIGKLRMLEMLFLGINDLTGTIPEELGNLTTLKQLGMSVNQLSGFIPQQVFNISTLQFMYIQRNKFLSGILPADMCSHLKQIEGIYLSENQIFGPLPTRFYECSSLQFIDLALNNLHGSIPPNIGNSTLLRALILTGNNLTGEIPQEVGHLNKLEDLYLSGNRLSGSIPRSLLNISSLRTLSLEKNQLTGNIPSNLGYKLLNLERLDLFENLLTSESLELSFITSLTNCRNLRNLGMNGNPLNGMLPASIGNFSTSMQNIYVNYCNLKGKIPEGIGNLSSLILLDLSGNQLTGSIPKSLENLRSLQALDLTGNKINGVIPSTICGLRNLNTLYLSNNQIFGAIPSCIGDITALSNLRLDFNKLSSTIPESLWNLREILFLNLSSNSLVGVLSPEMANLKAAVQIDLSMNRFSGVLPSGIGDLLTLSFLNLSHNELRGTIPESIADMINLEVLDISHNSISGEIPKSLQNLRYLTSFDVSFNDLSGEIPIDGPFKIFTFESFMSNKGLCGETRYHVHRCPVPNRKLRVLFISLGTLLIALVVALAFIGIARYRRKDKAPITGIMNFWSKGTRLIVSNYYELLAATNGYNESNLLGSGSYGSVYKGTLKNGKDVAVKVFNLELEGSFKSFEVECEVLRNLRHRNLCRVIGCCSNLDFKALVLEYMPCGSLEKWLYSHNYVLDIVQRISIMIDVACALEYLHQGYSVPVIHCDLKPSNILLDKNMTAHLCDFGIAKLLGDGESIVQTMTLATLSYIAPEYGTGGFVSVKCDVYSYGIVLMEVFTRKRPNDEMITGDLSLRSFVKDFVPNAVIEIIDPNLLRPSEDGLSLKLDCLSSILELGLNCSKESPHERMSIKDVIAALNRIKLQLLFI